VMCVSERFVIDFKVLRPAGVLTTEEEDEIAAGSFERMVRLGSVVSARTRRLTAVVSCRRTHLWA